MMSIKEKRLLEGYGLIHAETPERERPMPEPACHYDRPESLYPDSIRLSFPDGMTVVYDRRVKQPGPRRYLNMPRHEKRGRNR